VERRAGRRSAARRLSAAPEPAAPEEETVTGWYLDMGTVRGTRENIAKLARPLEPRPGASERLVTACRDAARNAASSWRVARIEAVSAGPETPTRDGGVSAPVEIRIIYGAVGNYEVTHATLTCELNALGAVVGLGS
jgi:hypothetical protein